jgi:membrane-bound serine protease (ClpP class)
MELIIILVVLGVLLLGSEVFLPSGFIGTLGGLCLAGGIGLAFVQDGPFAGLLTGAGSLLAVALVVVTELKLLPHTRAGRKMFNQSASTGKAVDTGSATAVELIGKTGRAATTFAPTGLAEIDGRQYEAACLDGHLRPGDPLAGRDNYKLLVKKAEEGGAIV